MNKISEENRRLPASPSDIPPGKPGMPDGDQRNILYSFNNARVAAGFDALLCSGQAAAASLLEYLSLNRVVLGSGAFCLIVAEPHWEENCGFETLLDANDCFAQLLETELSQRAVYHLLPLRGMVVCCLSMLQYTEFVEEIRQKQAQIYGYCDAAIAAYHEKTGLDVLVEVSPITFGTENLAGAFSRTLDRMQMCLFLGQTDGLLTHPENLTRRDALLYIEMEQDCAALQRLMQNRDYPGFQNGVRMQLRKLSALEPVAISIFDANCFRFLDLLFCRLTQSGTADRQMLARMDLWGMIQQAPDMPALEEKVLRLLDRLTETSRNRWLTAERQQVTIQEAQQYMRDNCADPDLTVTSAASHFHMAQPAFSVWFKKHAGMGAQEYLTGLRMEHAAVLLQTTDLAVEQIVRKTGFGSISALYRACRAASGMTPVQLRRSESAFQPEKPVP